MTPRIVVLDGYTLNPGDLSWDALRELGSVEVHDRTAPEQIIERAAGAEIVFVNKVPLRAETIAKLPELHYIGVLATGYDIVDVKAARERGVDVTNVPTYGTHSVAQFVFALLFELCHNVRQHADDVRSGGWSRNADWSYHLTPLIELAGKTLGVVGYGRIGRQAAAIGRALGMHVIAHDPATAAASDGTPLIPVEELLRSADVVTLHAPLTSENRGLINAERLSMMKPSAFLINTARGPLVVEEDLADSLNAGRLAGAGIDVLPEEPPRSGSPLIGAKNCLVTPHMAWATKEARARLMGIAVDNLRAWLSKKPVNVVNT